MSDNNQPKVYHYVSELMWPLLCYFVSMAEGSYLSAARAAELDQRPLGALYHRNWVTHHPGRGFRASREGLAAYNRYMGDARKRKNPEAPFSHYFELISDHLDRRPAEEKVRVIRHRGAA